MADEGARQSGDARLERGGEEPLGWWPFFVALAPSAWIIMFGFVALTRGRLQRNDPRVFISACLVLLPPLILWAVFARRAASRARAGRLYRKNHYRRWWCTRGVTVGAALVAVSVIGLFGPLVCPPLARVMGVCIDALGPVPLLPLVMIAPPMIYAGIRGFQQGSEPHCGACGYPCPSTHEGGLCPECGRGVWKWTVMMGRRVRSGRAVLVGVALVAVAAAPFVIALTGSGSLCVGAATNTSLAAMLGRGWACASRRDVWNEFAMRTSVSRPTREAAALRMVDLIGDYSRLESGMPAWIAQQFCSGELSDAAVQRVAAAAFPSSKRGMSRCDELADALLTGPLPPREERAVFGGALTWIRAGWTAPWSTPLRRWWLDRIGSETLSPAEESQIVEAAGAPSADGSINLLQVIADALEAHPTPTVTGRVVRIWTAQCATSPVTVVGFTPLGPLNEAVCAAFREGGLPADLETKLFAATPAPDPARPVPPGESMLRRAAKGLGAGAVVSERVAPRFTTYLLVRLRRSEPLWSEEPGAWQWLRARRESGLLSEEESRQIETVLEAARRKGGYIEPP